MSGHVKVNGMVTVVGDDVNSSAGNIRQAGADMYAHLRSLISSGQLTGNGIQRALEQSQARWDAACSEFAAAEQRFGQQCHDTYNNTMANDARCGGYF